jgi:hypothetical protein
MAGVSGLHDADCKLALPPLALPWHSPGTKWPVGQLSTQSANGPWRSVFAENTATASVRAGWAEAEADGHSPGTWLAPRTNKSTPGQATDYGNWQLLLPNA